MDLGAVGMNTCGSHDTDRGPWPTEKGEIAVKPPGQNVQL